MEVRGIDFTVYPCSNLERSIAFYKDVIGLKLDSKFGDFYAEFDVGGQAFALMTFGASEEPKPPARGGQVAFNVPDLSKALEELKSKGVRPHGGVEETPVCRLVEVADPDGNLFVLHEKPKVV